MFVTNIDVTDRDTCHILVGTNALNLASVLRSSSQRQQFLGRLVDSLPYVDKP